MPTAVGEPKPEPIRKRVRCDARGGCKTVIGWWVWKPTKAYANGFQFEPNENFGGCVHLRQVCLKHR